MSIKTEMKEAQKTLVPEIKEDEKEVAKILKHFGFRKKASEYESKNKSTESQDVLLKKFNHYITIDQLEKIGKKYGMAIVSPNDYKGDFGPNTVDKLKELYEDEHVFSVFVFCPYEQTRTLDQIVEYLKDPFLLVAYNKDYENFAVLDEWGDDITEERAKEVKEKVKKIKKLIKLDNILYMHSGYVATVIGTLIGLGLATLSFFLLRTTTELMVGCIFLSGVTGFFTGLFSDCLLCKFRVINHDNQAWLNMYNGRVM